MAIKLVISGCAGRMGRSIATLALQDHDFFIGAALEVSGHRAVGENFGVILGSTWPIAVTVSDDPKAAISQGDVLIEFTSPDVTIEHARLAQRLKKPMVIGTTGLTLDHMDALYACSKEIPIVWSPNMSVGVNVLFELAKTAAERLGSTYDVHVIESHHLKKKDAPSGTAKVLAEEIAKGRRAHPESVSISSIRAGDIVGDHTVMFAGPSERLELTHRAESRDVFAQGALKAAKFIVTQQSGIYDMSHVLKSVVGDTRRPGASPEPAVSAQRPLPRHRASRSSRGVGDQTLEIAPRFRRARGQHGRRGGAGKQ